MIISISNLSKLWSVMISILLFSASKCHAADFNFNTGNSLRAAADKQMRRALQGDGAITVVQPGEGVHTLRVAQTFFGNPGLCEEGSKNQAMMFFATFLDPDTLEPTCGVFQRDAGACFEQTVVIGCDPETNTASIDLYIRDEVYSGSMVTENPMIGRCRAGQEEVIRRAIKISETFNCISPVEGGDGFPNTCSEFRDDCLEGAYCNYSEELGYHCKTYVSVGTNCEGDSIDGQSNKCDPVSSFCLKPHICFDPSATGTCSPYLGICQQDSDCGSSAYCDEVMGVCKEKLKPGDCCTPNVDECDNGVCTADSQGSYSCSAYVGPGESCGGDLPAGQVSNTCDPVSSFCLKPNICSDPSASGTCSPYLGACQQDSDCGSSAYCDEVMGVCKEKIKPGDCCTPKVDECDQGFCTPDSQGAHRCRAYVGPGASCGGNLPAGQVNTCNPKESFCFYPDACDINDVSGTCVAYVGQCTSDSECQSNSYCDINEKKCKPKIPSLACCPPTGVDLCEIGTYCRTASRYAARCTPYVPVGTSCGGRTRMGEGGACDPKVSFCYYPKFCVYADYPGTCIAFTGSCTSDVDCGPDKYCDESLPDKKCKPRLDSGVCCRVAEESCKEGLVCRDATRTDPDAGLKCRMPIR